MSRESHLFQVGDMVTRDGTDVQEILKVATDYHTIEVVCRKAPVSGWCKVGDVESNLADRYVFVNRKLIEGGPSQNPAQERRFGTVEIGGKPVATVTSFKAVPDR